MDGRQVTSPTCIALLSLLSTSFLLNYLCTRRERSLPPDTRPLLLGPGRFSIPPLGRSVSGEASVYSSHRSKISESGLDKPLVCDEFSGRGPDAHSLMACGGAKQGDLLSRDGVPRQGVQQRGSGNFPVKLRPGN